LNSIFPGDMHRLKCRQAASAFAAQPEAAAAENTGKTGVVDFKTLIDSSEAGSSAKSELKKKAKR